MTQCKARSKRTGEQCQRPAMKGKEVCYHHGGRTPVGKASSNWKTGRYSKHLPSRMIQVYQDTVSDPELLDLTHEIGLLDARLNDLLRRVDTGESGQLWRRVSEVMDSVYNAYVNSNAVELAAGLNQLQTLINRGHSDFAIWHELGSLVEQRRRLVDSEQKRRLAINAVLTIEQAMSLVSALSSAVSEVVKDPGARQAIQSRVSEIIDGNSIR